MKRSIKTDNEALGRLAKWVYRHNACQTLTSRKIRSGTRLCLEMLTRMHLDELAKLANTPECTNVDQLPGIYTNRLEISRLTACGKRTVYDHLKRLQHAGIVRKQFRGRQHNFIVWVHPWITLGNAYSTPAITDLAIQ